LWYSADKVRWAVAGAAILIAALVAIYFVLAAPVAPSGNSGPGSGAGSLSSGGPAGSLNAFTFEPDSGKGPWTFGQELCLAQGNAPAVIESIEPVRADGSGYEFVGAMIREFPFASNESILEEAGFPPSVTQALHPAVGYAVTTACSSTGPPAHYTELDLGFGRGAGSDGGGWTGVKVSYKVKAKQYVLTLDDEIYVCGPAIPDVQVRDGCMATETLTPAPTPAGH
jgi:hypothetical protein